MGDNSLGAKVGSPVVLPVVGPWVTFTPVINNVGSKVFTNTGRYRQVGDSMEVEFNCVGNATASGSAATTQVSISVPGGYTIDATKVPTGTLNADGNNLGSGFDWSITALNTYTPLAGITPLNSTSIGFLLGSNTIYVQASSLNTARSMQLSGRVTLPIVGWEATVAYGAGLATSVKAGLTPPQTTSIDAVAVSSTQAGYTSNRRYFRAYQDESGAWRLKFTITGDFTSATVTGQTLTITGVTFKNVSGYTQACSGYWKGSSSVIPRVFANANTGTISMDSASVGSIVGMMISGDVELDSKPTWA